jgi:hypothetical protein
MYKIILPVVLSLALAGCGIPFIDIDIPFIDIDIPLIPGI